jgi:hypothetical protein
MALFGRKREERGPEPEPGPGWAAPMSQEETTTFVEAVGRELDRRGLPHEVGEGEVHVERGGESSTFGLSNLAQLCHQIGPHEWREAIGVHFDNLFAAADAEAELQEFARDFDNVRSMLKVRLYPPKELGGVDPGPPVSWELATGLTAVFVYDLPTTVRSASATHLEAWNRSRDELLAVALENVRADAVETRALDEGLSAPVACFADHFFAASHAFLLGERLPAEANGSAVFAVPHRHALLYAPLVDLGVVGSIQRLIPTAVSMFQEGPGSISPGLYWWRDGAVIPLPAQIDGPDIAFVPPDEFVQALNRLPEAG